MQPRITKITIKDYRAFWGDNNIIVLPQGENLLLYGENGSGKSSLYKGLTAFLASAASPQNLSDEANLFKAAGAAPSIQVEFTDLDASQAQTTYLVNEVKGIDLIEKANLSKAFFGYGDIQAIHTAERHNSGHFEVLLTILKDYTYAGNGQKLYDMWKGIEVESGKRWSQALEKRMEGWLTTFDAAMLEMRTSLTNEMKHVLGYFDNNLSIEFDYKPASYGRSDKLQVPRINIRVSFFERDLIDAYAEVLNEARLSSLAISLYLASLLTRPPAVSPYKILFLDDALIGLDSGNRMPLLKILKEKFADYQVFMTTYDRNWFEVSKRFVLKNHGNYSWKCIEAYAKDDEINGVKLTKPVLNDSESNLARAYYHFKHALSPDYPAAVNYLRKHLEEIIRENMPPKELKEQSGEMQESTRLLKPLLKKAKDFFERIHRSTATIDHIREKLRTLLNPLSH